MNICVEGIDGCGKSTHVSRIAEELKLTKLKFPDKDTQVGKLIYEHLDGAWHAQRPGDAQVKADPVIDPLVFQAMHTANRYEAADLIRKAKTLTGVVIDRYWPSGFAYGASDGVSPRWLIDVHTSLPSMDLYLLLDIDIQDTINRRPERRDRYEKDTRFLENVISWYRRLWAWKNATDHQGKWVVVNARGSKEQTYEQIDTAIKALYRERSK